MNRPQYDAYINDATLIMWVNVRGTFVRVTVPLSELVSLAERAVRNRSHRSRHGPAEATVRPDLGSRRTPEVRP